MERRAENIALTLTGASLLLLLVCVTLDESGTPSALPFEHTRLVTIPQKAVTTSSFQAPITPARRTHSPIHPVTPRIPLAQNSKETVPPQASYISPISREAKLQGLNVMQRATSSPRSNGMSLFEPIQVTPIEVSVPDYFNGRWYQIAVSNSHKSPFRKLFEANYKCVTADYYFNPCNKEHPVAVANTGILDNRILSAQAIARGTGKPGEFQVSFFPGVYAPYWVIHTESGRGNKYNAAIVFSQRDRYKALWVLSRSPRVSTKEINRLLSVAEKKGVDIKSMDISVTSHSDCQYANPSDVGGRPEDDKGCYFGLKGCEPRGWCSYQFKLGDLTPSDSCRLIPENC